MGTCLYASGPIPPGIWGVEWNYTSGDQSSSNYKGLLTKVNPQTTEKTRGETLKGTLGLLMLYTCRRAMGSLSSGC